MIVELYEADTIFIHHMIVEDLLQSFLHLVLAHGVCEAELIDQEDEVSVASLELCEDQAQLCIALETVHLAADLSDAQ